MQLDILRIVVSLVALLFASISDLKTREVPDTISYGLIITGIIFNAMTSIILGSFAPIIWSLASALILYGIARLLFTFSHFGGGDAKLLTAMGAMFGYSPLEVPTLFPFIITFFINLIIIGSFYGMLYAFTLAGLHASAFFSEFKRLQHDKKFHVMKRNILLMIIPAGLILNFLPIHTTVKIAGNALLLMIAIYPYVQMMAKAIESSCLTKTIPLSKLTPGDWLVQDVYKTNKILAHAAKEGIDEKEIAALKKAKIAAVRVRYGVPFVPAFLLTAIYTILKPEIFLFNV